MRQERLAKFVAAAALAAGMGLCNPAQAQTASTPPAANCIEVIAAQPGASPAIMLDKCSGQTWQLLRSSSGRHGVRYSWYPLTRQDAGAVPPRATSAGAPAVSRKPATAANNKCFSFNGRTFCE